MRQRIRKLGLLGRSVASFALAGAVLCGPAVVALGPVAPAQARVGDESLDTIILQSGRVIRGRVIEETDTQVRIEVVTGGISAERTFLRSEILDIKRAETQDDSDSEDALVESLESSTTTKLSTSVESTPLREPEVDPDAAQLYIVNLKGRWGQDVSETPLKELFKKVNANFDDLVAGTGLEEGRLVVDPEVRRKHILVLKVDLESPSGYNSIFRSEDLAPIVMDQIVQKRRRVVFWIEKAAGGAAFLPWVSPEIFFTTEGRLGGMADLDEFSSGDHLVDEKLIGAFLGSAEGFAIKGGYADHLDVMRAMLRRQNWLRVRFEGGRPIYNTRPIKDEKDMGGSKKSEESSDDDGYTWILLSDDGEGDNKDPSIFEGNDIFTLDADWGEKLGISDGTAETDDDLAFGLGVQRNYTVLDSSGAQKVLDRWTRHLNDAIEKANFDDRNGLPRGSLWREYDEITVQGDFNQRKRARGRKLSLLRKIRGYFTRFAESGDPKGQIRAQIDVMISQLRLQAETDARAQRGKGG